MQRSTTLGTMLAERGAKGTGPLPPPPGANFSETSFISFRASGPQPVRRHFQFPFIWAHARVLSINSRHWRPHIEKLLRAGGLPHTLTGWLMCHRSTLTATFIQLRRVHD